MTLYRQIAISIILLFMVGFLSTLFISTNNMRAFLATQLESHAQDAATSLGLSLSPHIQSRDIPVISTMVDAIFDRGDYRKIAVILMNGETLIERSILETSSKVPGWFIKAIPLQPTKVEALVMSGWRQAATVEVTSHPGHAYREIWKNSVDTLVLFLASAIVTLILGLLAVRVLLRPLHQVEIQADAICNQTYPIQEKLPYTRELKSVVMAMNRLSHKVNSFFTDQAALTERLREQAFRDPVTGLGNRRYFNRQLQALLDNRENAAQGALLLIELRQLVETNEQHGYAAGDLLLQRTGELLQSRIEQRDNSFCAHLAGAGFAIVLTGFEADDADQLAGLLCQSLQQLHAEQLVESDDICNMGITRWNHGDALTTLLTEADIALRGAQSAGHNCWQRYAPPADSRSVPHGASHWRTCLREIIAAGHVSLLAQPVYALNDSGKTLLHQEILLRIPDSDGSSVSAAVFMPMAERAGLACEMDKLVIDTMMKYLESSGDSTDFAVNLSSTSLNDSTFIDWLCKTLGASPDRAQHLLMEFPEYGVLRNIDGARETVARLAGIGCRSGIDHFGRGFASFGYLCRLRISYIKVDGGFSRNIELEEDNQFFIQALVDTAHSVDIKVIAQAIETPEERNTVKRLKVDGIQGYLTGMPEPLLRQ